MTFILFLYREIGIFKDCNTFAVHRLNFLVTAYECVNDGRTPVYECVNDGRTPCV